MTLYAKGTWRRYHVDPAELQGGLEAFFQKPRMVFALSALAGRAELIMGGDELDSSLGINPPDKPRLDCGYDDMDMDEADKYLLPHLATNLKDPENQEPWILPEGAEMPAGLEDLADYGWGHELRQFKLFKESAGVYGFWIVAWGKTDLVDKPSLREEKAAAHYDMPYKLLSADMKKELLGGKDEQSWDVMISRKQVPVILDIVRGDIWLASSSTKFAKALVAILARGMGIMLTGGELLLGNSRDWIRPALNAIRHRDLFKLERQEAIEWDQKDTELLEATLDEDAPKLVGPEAKRAEAEAAERQKFLTELATWAPDEGGEVMVLLAEASVALDPTATSSVTTAAGRDALDLFYRHPNAELVGCSGAINIPQPPSDDKGALAVINVDFTPELTQGIYRNLEFAACRSLWTELLEEPWIRGRGVSSVVDSGLDERIFGSRYARYWFRYYLQLRAFEDRLIHGFCRALDLDPEGVSVTTRSLFAPNKKTKGDDEAPAQREGQVVVTTDDFDDIPFVTD